MNPKHQAKCNELIDSLTDRLKAKCYHLYYSGGIATGEYDPDEYVLAKILVTAAMRDCADDYAPLLNRHKADLENLKHF